MNAERIDKGPAAARHRRELTHGADPTDPNRTVTRMRVRCLYDTAWKHGRITDVQREAADRLAVLHEIAAGARDRPTVPTGRTPPWMQGHPAQRQIDATTQLRLAETADGRVHFTWGNAARMWVVYGTALPDIGRIYQWREAETSRRVYAALQAMAEMWGME